MPKAPAGSRISQIIWRDPAALKPYERNSRTHSPDQIRQIRASIDRFGFCNPILLREDGRSIGAGHGRQLAALLDPALELVPTLVVEGLSDSEWRALIIADNKLALNAGWNDELLALELGELGALDFDLGLMGFNDDELANLFAKATIGATDPDDVPEQPVEPVTLLGDAWVLGKHRLVCGDSTDADTVAKCLDGVLPHLMVTDPPYGVEYDANWRNEADRANGKPYGARAVGLVSNDSRADWREAWMLFPGDVVYVWHAGRHASEVQTSLEAANFAIRSQIIWAKDRLIISRGDYHWQHEPCWYAVRKNRKGHFSGGRSQTTLWEISHSKSETGHSTQKPVECMKRPIENNSRPGDAVYEPFSGSGTTIIAGEMTSRPVYAIELNPVYVDVAILRWQSFTGLDGIHEETGLTFDQMRAQRLGKEPSNGEAAEVKAGA